MDPISEEPHDREERDRLLAAAIDACLEEVEHGGQVDARTLAARYPGLEAELQEVLETVLLLHRSRVRPAETPASGVLGLAPPARVSGYRILAEVGRGGMGVVYRAWQSATKRVVALKFLASGASPAARRRFEREVELAAALDHPGIVRVLEGGEAEGNLYCAMEFIDGDALHEHLARHDPPLGERLRLLAEIADAVHYAHLHGVVHRDLKPSNIMIDRSGRPRVLDFGLARFAPGAEAPAQDRDEPTRVGQVVGTLPYLSPEQASAAAGTVDLRSDVYALGVILYEMLTGRLPYDVRGTLREVLERISSEMPARPSRFRPEIGRDLDAIALKALEKSKGDRYQSAAALAEDVRSYVRREPVEARRASSFYLVRKAYARHRRQVQAAAAILALLLGSSAVVLVLYLQLRREEAELRDELHENRLRIAAEHLAASHDLFAEPLLLDAYRSRPDRRASWSLTAYAVQNPLVAELLRVGWTTGLAWSPDGARLARGNLVGEIAVHDVRHGFSVLFTARAGSAVRELAFSPDGGRLAAAGADGSLEIFGAETGEREARLEAHRGAVNGLRFGRRGLLSYGEDGRVLLWDEGSWSARELWRSPEGQPVLACDRTEAGSRLAIASGEAWLVLDVEDGSQRAVSSSPDPVEAVRFSPDGRRLAVWTRAEIAVLDAASGARLWTAAPGLAEPRPAELWEFAPGAVEVPSGPHALWVPRLAFSQDGALLACAGWDAVVRLWEAEGGRALGGLRAHGTAVYSTAFDPTSRRLAVGCVGSVRVWDLDLHPGPLSRELGQGCEQVCVAVSTAADRVAWAGYRDGTIRAARLSTFAREKERAWSAHGAAVQALAFDPRGRLLAAADQGGEISLWDGASLEPAGRWRSEDPSVRALAFSPDGEQIVTGGWDGSLRLWRACGEPVAVWRAHAGRILCVAFAPDGKRIASGGTDFRSRVWRLQPGGPTLEDEWRHDEWVNAVAFAPDGRLATGGADLRLRIGRIGAAPRRIEPTHAHWITGLCFLDGGRILGSCGYDRALRLWDAESCGELASVPALGQPIECLAATEEGRWIVLGESNSIQVIDLEGASDLVARWR